MMRTQRALCLALGTIIAPWSSTWSTVQVSRAQLHPPEQVLDMVTDRLATAGLLAVLGMLYPRSYMVFLALMFLDIFSHWFQMYSTFISGSETHKARGWR